MGITPSLKALRSEMRSYKMRKSLTSVIEAVEEGVPMWQAFEMLELFPDHAIALLRIGEESGRLSDNLQVIAIENEKSASFRSKLQSAMLYPAFVLVIAAGVGVGIAWFILPRLAKVFEQLDVTLPGITRFLMWFGELLQAHGVILVPIGLLLFGLFIHTLFFNKKTKFIGQTILFYIPAIRKLVLEIEVARFGYLLGTLLKAGLPIIDSLDSLEKSTIFAPYKKMYAYLRDSIADGNTFHQSFILNKKSDKLFPKSVQQMIVSGEKSAGLPGILLKMGEVYEVKIEDTTKNLSVLLEPILLVIVWLGVVGVALAVILPIYTLVGQFETGGATGGAPVNPYVEKVEESEVPEHIKELFEDSSDTNTDNITSIENNLDEQQGIDNQKQKTFIQVDSPLSTLNVRQEASATSSLVTTIPNGGNFEYIKKENNWYQIIVNENIIGWVFGDYVIEQENEIAP